MIVIVGGFGFIGSHVTRALLDLGESCVVVSRRDLPVPALLAGAGDRLVAERVDVSDREAFLELGKRYAVTGIVNMVGAFGYSAPDPLDDARLTIDGLLNVVQAARDWGVPRVGNASTIGVYLGAPGTSPHREDATLPVSSGNPIAAFKKIGEVLSDHLAAATGVEVINYRISAIWGPLGRTASPFFPIPQLIHAAAAGTEPDLGAVRFPAWADDGIDALYVRDCGRAIALLQLAERLSHSTYNVGAGRQVSYREIIGAIRKVVPDARVDLPDGTAPGGFGEFYLDTSRLRADTGFEPVFDPERAVADYLGWLALGNPR